MVDRPDRIRLPARRLRQRGDVAAKQESASPGVERQRTNRSGRGVFNDDLLPVDRVARNADRSVSSSSEPKYASDTSRNQRCVQRRCSAICQRDDRHRFSRFNIRQRLRRNRRRDAIPDHDGAGRRQFLCPRDRQRISADRRDPHDLGVAVRRIS